MSTHPPEGLNSYLQESYAAVTPDRVRDCDQPMVKSAGCSAVGVTPLVRSADQHAQLSPEALSFAAQLRER